MPEDEQAYDVHPLGELLLKSLAVKEERRQLHLHSVHIDVAEPKEERLCLTHQSFRALYGLDSQVSRRSGEGQISFEILEQACAEKHSSGHWC